MLRQHGALIRQGHEGSNIGLQPRTQQLIFLTVVVVVVVVVAIAGPDGRNSAAPGTMMMMMVVVMVIILCELRLRRFRRALLIGCSCLRCVHNAKKSDGVWDRLK